MRLWFSRQADVPIREQLATQIILAIVSGDLAPGQRLPSTRELSRRYDLHPNTVSAAYQQLERDRWLEVRRGSGVYVRKTIPKIPLSPELKLDQLVLEFFRSARELGASLSQVRQRLRRWVEMQTPDHFLVIEPELSLAIIIGTELGRAVTLPVRILDAPQFPTGEKGGRSLAEFLHQAIPVVLPSKADLVRQALPPGTDLLVLQVRSVEDSLSQWLPAPSTALVGVASHWPRFLELARTMLIASGFHPDALVLRDTRQRGWRNGLAETQAVVCDVCTAKELPRKCRAIEFPLIAECSVEELKAVERFITSAAL